MVQLEEQLDKTLFASLRTLSPKMEAAVNVARKISESEVTVLIHGETGVGKEVFAKAIHNASSRKEMPFIPVNMASIPEGLFESELFGYDEGSFTGSRKGGKQGIFELANGGTLFLDEIGELPLSAQAKLLRVIQERTYRRVGGLKQYKLDVRLITATNRNLLEEMQQKRFREDLYYRLCVVPIQIPPLRERKEDLPLLISNILSELSTKYRKNIKLSDEVIAVFQQYDWPGNVRELANVLERVITTSPQGQVELDQIPELNLFPMFAYDSASGYAPIHEAPEVKLNIMLESTERDMITRAINDSKSKTEAIQRLGISRKTFYAKLNKYKLL
jgi:transcriptional regulator with PAS, ATPase and Fis domain